MRFAIIISALLHVAAVGIWFVLPDSWRPVRPADPIVPIEIISEAELSDRLSVVETRKEPEAEAVEQPAPEEIEEQPPVPATQPEQPQETEPEPEPVQLPPEPEEQEPEPVEEPKKEEPKEEPKKEEPKKDPPKKDPPKKDPPKEPELDLSALESALTDLDREETNAPRETPTETGQAQQADRDANQVGLGDKLTASEEALFKSRMKPCWNINATAGAPEPEKLLVRVQFELTSTGALKNEPKVLNALQIRTSGNPFWLVAQREAVSAVIKCAPYDFLPPERYSQTFILNFDPSQMAGVN